MGDTLGQLTRLIEQEHGRLVNHLNRTTRDYHLAEDIAQQMYLHLWRCLPRLRYISHSLFYQAAHQKLAEHYRVQSLKRQPPTTTPDAMCYIEDAGGIAAAEMRMEVALCLSRMTDTERVPVLLYINGYSYAQIGVKLRIPLGTVKSRLNWAKHAQYRNKQPPLRKRTA